MTSIVHNGYSSASSVPSWDPPPPPISAEEKKKLDAELDDYMRGRGGQRRFRKSRRHNKSRRVSNRRRRNKSRKTKRIR